MVKVHNFGAGPAKMPEEVSVMHLFLFLLIHLFYEHVQLDAININTGMFALILWSGLSYLFKQGDNVPFATASVPRY